MNETERSVMVQLRDIALEMLYCESKYSAWAHTLASAIRDADVALGQSFYTDLRLRYPGPRKSRQAAA